MRRHGVIERLVPALLAIAAAATSAEGATWVDARVAGPFVCRADFPLSGMEGFFVELEQLQKDLVRLLGVRPAPETIELCLFHDERSYRRYLQESLPSVPYRRALYFKEAGPGRVLVQRSREFHVDIRHECTHALLHATLPMVPLWLDEGLAEYFEVAPADRAYGNPYLEGTRWAARLGLVPRLERLEKEGSFTEMGANDYRDSWAWVHFMLHGPPEARDELVRFLADIQASAPPGLLSQRLARRLPNLRGQFASHFKSWRPPRTSLVPLGEGSGARTWGKCEDKEALDTTDRPHASPLPEGEGSVPAGFSGSLFRHRPDRGNGRLTVFCAI